MNPLRFLLVAMLLWGYGVQQSAAAPPSGKRYAVLIGVENYQHAKLREPKLQYPVEDVTELSQILSQAGYEVILLTDAEKPADRQPTKANIDRQISAVLRKCQAGDTVILAFSGHGLQFSGEKDAYFCPSDARPFSSETKSLVSIAEVYQELDKSFASVKLILVDACRNDPDPSRGRGVDADSAPEPKLGMGALFSCSAGQRAYEHDQLKHGVFFYHIIKGLQGKAADDDGEVTFNRLSDHVMKNVPRDVDRLLDMREQSPNQKANFVGAPPVLLKVAKVPSSRTADSMPPSKTSLEFIGKKPGDVRSDNGLQMKLIWCPPGKFTMGSPEAEKDRNDNEAQVEVTLSNGFWLGRTEVTKGEWTKLMGSEPWKGQSFVEEGADYPATFVSWQEGEDFCQKMTVQERRAGRLPEDWEYRYPSEAQWEYGCRGGSKTAYSFGDNEKQLGDYAWFATNAGIIYSLEHPVGSKKPNAWGLCDMHGNVREWCQDWYAKTLPGGRDPEVTSEASSRVDRGGWAHSSSAYCRSASRRGGAPAGRRYMGFRVAVVQSSR